jgi:hypothetical protein
LPSVLATSGARAVPGNDADVRATTVYTAVNDHRLEHAIDARDRQAAPSLVSREVVPFAVELRGGDPVISERLRA